MVSEKSGLKVWGSTNDLSKLSLFDDRRRFTVVI